MSMRTHAVEMFSAHENSIREPIKRPTQQENNPEIRLKAIKVCLGRWRNNTINHMFKEMFNRGKFSRLRRIRRHLMYSISEFSPSTLTCRARTPFMFAECVWLDFFCDFVLCESYALSIYRPYMICCGFVFVCVSFLAGSVGDDVDCDNGNNNNNNNVQNGNATSERNDYKKRTKAKQNTHKINRTTFWVVVLFMFVCVSLCVRQYRKWILSFHSILLDVVSTCCNNSVVVVVVVARQTYCGQNDGHI